MSKKNRQPREITQLDIVIPIYSNYETLDKVLMKLGEACKDIKYKIYLVDDHSPDYEIKGKEFLKHVRLNFPNFGGLLIHNQNGGFSKSCNDGANMGSSDLIMFLSTDVILMEDSVKIMVDHITESKDPLGIVFPKLLFFPNSNDPNRPAGKVQSAGTVFDINKNPYHIFNGWDTDHPFVNRVKDLNCCTGACFVIKRNVFRKAGGFDVNFGTGTFEDCALSLIVRSLGYKIRYLPQAVGYHYVGMSAEITKTAFPMGKNRNYFLAKFSSIIPFDEWIFAM